jgi:hypothetical protein
MISSRYDQAKGREDVSTRFELDETKAAEYLAAQVAQFECWEATRGSNPAELEIGSEYDPRDYMDEGFDTSSVVTCAWEAGLLTGPGIIDFDYYRTEDAGYAWMVTLDGPWRLQLSGGFNETRYLGDGSKGAAGALAVLREAVDAANEMLGNLDGYAVSVRPAGGR